MTLASELRRVLAIGATGTTGGLLCRELIGRGVPVTAASRTGCGTAGARSVQFDWYSPATYERAVAGAEAVYLIAPTGEPAPEAVMRPFLQYAASKKVRRAVLLSSSLVPAGGPGLGRVHELVAETFDEWAVLRPSWFMQNFTNDHMHARNIGDRGLITTATGDGRVAFIDAHDIARFASAILVGQNAPNTDLTLTGPSALSYADVASIISRASGRTVRHQQTNYQHMCEIHRSNGLPEAYAEMLAGLDALIATGAEDRVTDTVARVTGRTPTTFETFVTREWACETEFRAIAP